MLKERMASGRYRAVLESERFMNDAISCVMANLHRAARKKINHVRPPYRHDSLTWIWGDDETNETESRTSHSGSPAKGNSSVRGNDSNILGNNVEMTENHPERDASHLVDRQSEKIIPTKCQNTDDPGRVYGGETYPRSYDLRNPSDFSSDLKYFESVAALFNDEQRKFSGNFRRDVQYGVPNRLSFSKRNELSSLKESRHLDNYKERTEHAYDESGYTQSETTTDSSRTFYPSKNSASSADGEDKTMNRLSDNESGYYTLPENIFLSTMTFYSSSGSSGNDEDGTTSKSLDGGSRYTLPENTLTTFHPIRNGASSGGEGHETTSRLLSKTRRIRKLSKEFETALVGQNASKSKRNRDDSDSSTGSIHKPLQKKRTEEDNFFKSKDEKDNFFKSNDEKDNFLKSNDEKDNFFKDKDEKDNFFKGKDEKDNFFKTLLSVRILKEDQFYEITVSASEFDRIRKKYPQLMEVLPDIDTFEKEVPYCAEAVKVVIRYLFHPSYDFNSMPDGRISVEILAATKAWAIQRFHDNFQQHFVKKITESNCRTIHSLARHFGLQQICDACMIFAPDGELGDGEQQRRSHRSRKCTVAVSLYVEPLELCVPLGTAEQLLDDNFDRDIRNTLVFEAIAKDFTIAGFQICLDNSHSTLLDGTSASLDIFYSIKLTNKDREEVKLCRPLRPNIVVYFKRKITVKKREKVQISVETTIKPYLCFVTYESLIKTSNEFSLTVESTYRVNNSGGKRFIVGKLLYNAEDQV